MKLNMIALVSEQAIPNLMAAVKLKPSSIHLLFTQDLKIQKTYKNLKSYLNTRIPGIRVYEHLVDAKEPDSTHQVIKSILSETKEMDHVINVTGGTKLMALGAYQAGIEGHCGIIYVDTAQNKFLNLGSFTADFPGGPSLPRLKVDDFIGLYGAQIKHEKTSQGYSNLNCYKPLVESLISDPKSWEETLNYFNVAKGRYLHNYTLAFKGSKKITGPNRKKFRCFPSILYAYKKAKMIKDLTIHQAEISFKFMSPKAQDFILRKGTPLELFTFYKILELTNVDDLRLDVEYLWGGYIGEKADIKNEIDVMVSAGSRLVCFSCKSGAFTTADLIEIDAHAQRLGGVFAGKVLVLGTQLLHSSNLRSRAKEMGIKIIDIEDIKRDAYGAFKAAIFGTR